MIFFYTATTDFTWNLQYGPYDDVYVEAFFTHIDPDGRRWQRTDLTGPGLRQGDSGLPWRDYNPSARKRHWQPPSYFYDKYERLTGQILGELPLLERLERMDSQGLIHWPSKAGGMPRGKRYLEDAPGIPLQDVWTDIKPMHNLSDERLGYPTQKPRVLLERIISSSSNPGDVVLDPFCGCGTAVDAAQKLDRRWIGIDITHLAIGLVEKRLNDGYNRGGNREAVWETIGVPADLESAQRLATDDPHQFQHWITLKLGGYPWMGGKKGGDKGVDGYFYYVGDDGSTKTGVISVKAGNNVNPAMVRDLGRVMARDGHDLGVFVCAAMPTRGMEDEANSHGLFETHFGGDTGAVGNRYPKLQIFTLAELFQDRRPKLPPLVSPNRRAARVETRESHKGGAQGGLNL